MAVNKKPTCSIETITPELALEWLESNTGNFRRLDSARVFNYMQEMQSGRWDLNGETIKFSGSQLLDGQHRLAAIVDAGVSVQSFVARNIEADATHIDRGKPRTVSQWLAHLKVKNSALVGAVARLVVGHDKNIWDAVAWGVSEMTDSEVIDCALKYHEEINASIPSGSLPRLPRSLVTAVVFIGSGHKDASKNSVAVWFCNGLFKGADLSETDAVLHLRNKLKGNTGSTAIGRYAMKALVTMAWNKTILGQECSTDGMRIRLAGPPSHRQSAPKRILTEADAV